MLIIACNIEKILIEYILLIRTAIFQVEGMSLKLSLTGSKLSKKFIQQWLKNCVPFLQIQSMKNIFNLLATKKVSSVLLMNKPARNVPSISYGISETNSFKVKAKNKLQLLDTLKDRMKWKMIHAQNGQNSSFQMQRLPAG